MCKRTWGKCENSLWSGCDRPEEGNLSLQQHKAAAPLEITLAVEVVLKWKRDHQQLVRICLKAILSSLNVHNAESI